MESPLDMLEVVSNSDYTGDRNSRKSVAVFQVFLDGNVAGRSEELFYSMCGHSSDYRSLCEERTAVRPAAWPRLAGPGAWMRA